jgi:hypothetical protein
LKIDPETKRGSFPSRVHRVCGVSGEQVSMGILPEIKTKKPYYKRFQRGHR